MRVLDLFAGIGGFSLAAHWMGWETAAFVERDKFCQRVLRKNFGQDIEIHDDIRSFTAEPFRGTVELITGGFPCPAFSQAGKRGGFDQDDLFFELLRAVRECDPKWFVLENVEGITKWIPEVRQEIQNLGYEFADAIFDGRDFGVAQMRRRYFAVCLRRRDSVDTQLVRRIQGDEGKDIHRLQPYYPNAERRWTPTVSSKDEWRAICFNARKCGDVNGIPNRMDRLRTMGNSINPQIAYEIFRAIEDSEK